MAKIDYPYTNGRNLPGPAPAPTDKPAVRVGWTREWWFRLLALLLFSELIVSFLLWRAGLPRNSDILKDLVAGVIILLTFAYMLTYNRIPMALLFILGATLIWGLVAVVEGQSIGATAWGWWRFFKYPLLMVFVYLIPRWPRDFPRLLIKLLVIVMFVEVGVQLVQFALGQPPGDSLAGTFGWKGVMELSLLSFFIVCIGLGHWLGTGDWKVMLTVLTLGLVASMLSVTKFYLPAAVIMGLVALALHMIRGGRFRQLLLYIVLFVLAAAVFVPVYNNFIATTRGLKPLQEYLTMESIEGYLFRGDDVTDTGRVKLGRGLAVTYAWQQIQRDPTTTFFGFGLGSRTYSTALGLTGESLEDDLYGGGGATTMGVWIQEFGAIGSALFIILNLWIAAKLMRHARTTPDHYLASLAYGLIIFTLLWPVWMWYHKVWLAGATMFFYWTTLGYVFQRIYRPRRQTRRHDPARRFIETMEIEEAASD
jgi:hypothetical protein